MLEVGIIFLVVVLTNDVQMDEVAHVWGCADLALVDA
jgi:hypothetical protein